MNQIGNTHPEELQDIDGVEVRQGHVLVRVCHCVITNGMISTKGDRGYERLQYHFRVHSAH